MNPVLAVLAWLIVTIAFIVGIVYIPCTGVLSRFALAGCAAWWVIGTIVVVGMVIGDE